MNDERRNGNGGSGGGGDSGEVDALGSADDTTVVIVSDEFTRRAIVRLAASLRAAADRCDRIGALGGEAASQPERIVILGELGEDFQDIRLHAEGAERGVARLEREAIRSAGVATAKKTNETKETKR